MLHLLTEGPFMPLFPSGHHGLNVNVQSYAVKGQHHLSLPRKTGLSWLQFMRVPVLSVSSSCAQSLGTKSVGLRRLILLCPIPDSLRLSILAHTSSLRDSTRSDLADEILNYPWRGWAFSYLNWIWPKESKLTTAPNTSAFFTLCTKLIVSCLLIAGNAIC